MSNGGGIDLDPEKNYKIFSHFLFIRFKIEKFVEVEEL